MSDQVTLEKVMEKLDRMEALMLELRDRGRARDYYTPLQVGEILDRDEFTVQQWCRQGRVRAQKKGSGRGPHQGWVISHEELLRIQREGLLPKTKAG
jgi:hypothetical protein